MNKFIDQFYEDRNEEKKGLELKDIVSWKEKGKMSNGYMVIKFSGGSFGLFDTDSATIQSIQFLTMKELENYLLNKSVDENKINVLSADDWTIYVP